MRAEPKNLEFRGTYTIPYSLWGWAYRSRISWHPHHVLSTTTDKKDRENHRVSELVSLSLQSYNVGIIFLDEVHNVLLSEMNEFRGMAHVIIDYGQVSLNFTHLQMSRENSCLMLIPVDTFDSVLKKI